MPKIATFDHISSRMHLKNFFRNNDSSIEKKIPKMFIIGASNTSLKYQNFCYLPLMMNIPFKW